LTALLAYVIARLSPELVRHEDEAGGALSMSVLQISAANSDSVDKDISISTPVMSQRKVCVG